MRLAPSSLQASTSPSVSPPAKGLAEGAGCIRLRPRDALSVRRVAQGRDRSSARRGRRRARAAHGRAVRAKATIVQDACNYRFSSVGHAVTPAVGTAVCNVAMAPAGIAGRCGAPITWPLAAGHPLRHRRYANGHETGNGHRGKDGCRNQGHTHAQTALERSPLLPAAHDHSFGSGGGQALLRGAQGRTWKLVIMVVENRPCERE